jgi:CBS domain-containing protein
MDALRKMQDHKIGCLPVLSENKLVGIITEKEYLRITASFLSR